MEAPGIPHKIDVQAPGKVGSTSGAAQTERNTVEGALTSDIHGSTGFSLAQLDDIIARESAIYADNKLLSDLDKLAGPAPPSTRSSVRVAKDAESESKPRAAASPGHPEIRSAWEAAKGHIDDALGAFSQVSPESKTPFQDAQDIMEIAGKAKPRATASKRGMSPSEKIERNQLHNVDEKGLINHLDGRAKLSGAQETAKAGNTRYSRELSSTFEQMQPHEFVKITSKPDPMQPPKSYVPEFAKIGAVANASKEEVQGALKGVLVLINQWTASGVDTSDLLGKVLKTKFYQDHSNPEITNLVRQIGVRLSQPK